MKKDELSNLVYHKKNIYESSSEEELKKIFDFAEGYKSFLNNCKTERECCSQVIEEAKAKGFSEFHFGDKLKSGDKRYFINRDKGVILFKIGKNRIEREGIRIILVPSKEYADSVGNDKTVIEKHLNEFLCRIIRELCWIELLLQDRCDFR